MLGACEEKSEMQTGLSVPQCISSQQQCSQVTSHGEYHLLFDVDKVITETPFNYYLDIKSSYSVHRVDAYIEGKEMYMGKIPVFFMLNDTSKEEKLIRGAGLLGSCADEYMLWVMHIAIEFKDSVSGEVIKDKISFEFTSQRF